MKKRVREFWSVMKRIGDANLNMDHYWFLPRPVVIPLHEKSELDVEENAQLHRSDLHKGSMPRYVTNYKLRQSQK